MKPSTNINHKERKKPGRNSDTKKEAYEKDIKHHLYRQHYSPLPALDTGLKMVDLVFLGDLI